MIFLLKIAKAAKIPIKFAIKSAISKNLMLLCLVWQRLVLCLEKIQLVHLRRILIYKVFSCFCIKALLKYNNNIDGIVSNEVTI